MTKKQDQPKTALQQVRALQGLARRLRKAYLRPGSDDAKCRDAVQGANDSTFTNPAPGADAASKERWAARWLKRYNQYRLPPPGKRYDAATDSYIEA